MSFRKKLLMVFALTVFFAVAIVSFIVSSMARRAFQKADEERTAALVAQFRSEFNRRGAEVTRRIDAIASSDAVTRMALSVSNNAPDYGAYLNEAKTIADSQQLDFLVFTDAEGTIVSSAQSPARFGYKEPAVAATHAPTGFYLKKEELNDGVAIGMFAAKTVRIGDKPLNVIGGRRLDPGFLASLELPAGMRVLLYQNIESAFSPKSLSASSGTLASPEKLASLIERAQRTGQETTEIVHWTSDPADDESVLAIPLKGPSNEPLGVLLVGSSRRTYVDLERRIRSAALLVGGAGIIVAVLLSGWVASRVTRPVEQLASAARLVAEGNWDTQVRTTSSDEVGDLAAAFNRMTRELVEQKEQLVQTERVAAWRELARRLAHELKNPLFPLQLTVENLLRARQRSPEQFDEIFQESSATLLAEISQPQSHHLALQRFLEDAATAVSAGRPQRKRARRRHVSSRRNLRRANKVTSNAPRTRHRASRSPRRSRTAPSRHLQSRSQRDGRHAQGGRLTLRTRHDAHSASIEVADTGVGLTPEECERLFTPYYTSKRTEPASASPSCSPWSAIMAAKSPSESEPGRGTTFRIHLPLNANCLPVRSRFRYIQTD